jgi:hypothetical protein
VDHSDGADDKEYGGYEPGLNARQAEILYDLRQEEEEAPLTRERKKTDETPGREGPALI